MRTTRSSSPKAKPGTSPKKSPPARPAPPDNPDPGFWDLRLYVAGSTARSAAAVMNLKEICEKNLAGRYRIEVIDLVQSPHLAQGDQIVAIPTLVRKLPHPIKKIIGDLSNTERALVGLDLRPRTQ